MLNNKNALVILWTGNDIPDDLVREIGEIMTRNGVCIPETMKIVYKDQDGLAQCLIREVNGVSTIKFDVATDELAEALKQAVILIGKRFENLLVNTRNLTPFALKLSSELSKAKNNVSFNILGASDEDKALVRAVELISTTKAVIPATLAKKYHFTKEVCETIKIVFNQFT